MTTFITISTGRPVLAQGDTAVYRARKFVARHQRPAWRSPPFVLVFMALAVVATGSQARRGASGASQS